MHNGFIIMTLIARKMNDIQIAVLALYFFLGKRREPSNIDTI
jgi:hypothetical protein